MMFEYLRNRFGKKKIFVIGLNKSGTTTLHRFFESNGLKSAHWDHRGINIAATVALNLSKGRPALSSIDQFHAYSDMCFHTNVAWIEGAEFFKQFEAEYPDAYFIFNYRDVEKFLKSRSQHPEELQRAMAYWNCSAQEVLAIWREYFHKHKAKVLSHFQNNPRFLAFDIEKDDPQAIVDLLRPDYTLDARKYRPFKVTAEKRRMVSAGAQRD